MLTYSYRFFLLTNACVRKNKKINDDKKIEFIKVLSAFYKKCEESKLLGFKINEAATDAVYFFLENSNLKTLEDFFSELNKKYNEKDKAKVLFYENVLYDISFNIYEYIDKDVAIKKFEEPIQNFLKEGFLTAEQGLNLCSFFEKNVEAEPSLDSEACKKITKNALLKFVNESFDKLTEKNQNEEVNKLVEFFKSSITQHFEQEILDFVEAKKLFEALKKYIEENPSVTEETVSKGINVAKPFLNSRETSFKDRLALISKFRKLADVSPKLLFRHRNEEEKLGNQFNLAKSIKTLSDFSNALTEALKYFEKDKIGHELPEYLTQVLNNTTKDNYFEFLKSANTFTIRVFSGVIKRIPNPEDKNNSEKSTKEIESPCEDLKSLENLVELLVLASQKLKEDECNDFKTRLLEVYEKQESDILDKDDLFAKSLKLILNTIDDSPEKLTDLLSAVIENFDSFLKIQQKKERIFSDMLNSLVQSYINSDINDFSKKLKKLFSRFIGQGLNEEKNSLSLVGGLSRAVTAFGKRVSVRTNSDDSIGSPNKSGGDNKGPKRGSSRSPLRQKLASLVSPGSSGSGRLKEVHSQYFGDLGKVPPPLPLGGSFEESGSTTQRAGLEKQNGQRRGFS